MCSRRDIYAVCTNAEIKAIIELIALWSGFLRIDEAYVCIWNPE